MFWHQVFLENPSSPGKYTVILPPVCTRPIYDAKAKKELQIMDISDNSAPADGGKKIIILCEKVSKEDIKVRFFDYNGWEEYADFGPSDVHKQYAISFKVPRYQNVNILQRQKVCVELVKSSDDTRSEEEEFWFTPVNGEMEKPVMETKVELTPKFPHNGGFVTEVKNEVLTDGSAWKQMTSQAGPMTVKPRVDPYSKVVLTDGNLGLGGMDYGNPGYEFNIPVTNSPYLIPQSSPDSQGLANLNISDVTSLNVTSTDLANILGQAGSEDHDILSDNLETSLNISPATTNRSANKRNSRDAENDSASIHVPRQMERQQSSISTPNVSSNLSELQNGLQMFGNVRQPGQKSSSSQAENDSAKLHIPYKQMNDLS